MKEKDKKEDWEAKVDNYRKNYFASLKKKKKPCLQHRRGVHISLSNQKHLFG